MKIGMIAPEGPVTLEPLGWNALSWTTAMLVEGLIARGHQVIVWGHPDSATRAELRSNTSGLSRDRFRYEALRDALESGVDIIHTHHPHPPHYYLLLGLSVPQVRTYHAYSLADRGTWGVLQRMLDPHGSIANVALSADHREVCPAGLEYDVIPWGLDPVAYSKPPLPKGEYLATFSRLHPVKGIHHAIEVAKRADLPLKIAGPICPVYPHVSRAYFETMIAPHLSDGRIQYVGEIKRPEEKLEFLRGAKALLNPIQPVEPFGMSVLESLFVGTPVVSFRCGGPAETIENGVSGFLVDTAEEMAEAVGKLDELRRETVQKSSQERYPAEKVAESYERLYARKCSEFQGHAPDVARENMRLLAELNPEDPEMRSVIQVVRRIREKSERYRPSLWQTYSSLLTGRVNEVGSALSMASMLTQCKPWYRGGHLVRAFFRG